MPNAKFMFLVMVFATIVVLILGFASRSRDKSTTKNIQRRIEGALNKNQGNPNLSILKEVKNNTAWFSALQKLIQRTGRSTSITGFLTVSIIIATLGGMSVYLFSKNIIFAMMAASVLGSLPLIKIKIDFSRKMALFEEQLPDAIDIMVRALRAGYPFNETLGSIGDEMKPPISTEFKATFLDINYGSDTKQAFINLLDRIPSTSLLSLVTAVIIQKETGGNLTEVLDKIGTLIRANFSFKRRVKTLSAEGRMSAWILILIPLILGGVMMVIQPNYISALVRTSTGIHILEVSITLMILGIIWINRMIKSVSEV